jgi:hypothetical protein
MSADTVKPEPVSKKRADRGMVLPIRSIHGWPASSPANPIEVIPYV